MMEQDRTVRRSRYTMKLAIVVVICLMLSYCSHRLYSASKNGVSNPLSMNQENFDSANRDKTETQLFAQKKETTPPPKTGHILPEDLNKDVHQHEKIPTLSDPVKTKPLLEVAQSKDLAQQQETSASSRGVSNTTKNAHNIERQGSTAHATQVTTAGTVAQTLEVHQDTSENNPSGAFDKTFTEPVSGMEFILVKGGCYQMGSNLTAFEGPVHEVCVDDFYLAKYEVTQRQWTKIMGRHFSYFKGSLRPVERVTWDDSQRFIRQLNSRSGATYRLPTEAEWEYAARSGGVDKVYSGTSDDESLQRFAWHVVNSNQQTHMVGMKKPNSLGLHDMSGNVWEWCSDWYDDSYYANSTRNNPQGPDTGRYRVIRGGEWELPAGLTRTTYREAAKPNIRRNDIGFRLALSLPN